MTDNVIEFPKSKVNRSPTMNLDEETIMHVFCDVFKDYSYDDLQLMIISCFLTYIGNYKDNTNYSEEYMMQRVNNMIMKIISTLHTIGLYDEIATKQLIHKLKQSYTVDTVDK
jgi:hypothetical protein